ncbi:MULTISPECIES: anti-sigma factor domain-containing protein [unclassified Sphingobacterium]|uniref:anti-sigma factor n=1 Tax=unclassified Sphingobacterium TaxID=2609468 RepID=UPI001AEB79F1|nr:MULTISPECIES: anti-sigma factor [unclassified Sphingobacterium]MDR6735323.1 anti-sigma-K factor RskA [Sphingobacterium sp. 2149]
MDIKAYISSGIIESYVLGLASEEEVSILNCIRKNNVEVEQAIAEAEIALEQLADNQAIEMPMQLKQNIWNRLVTENLVPSEGEEVIETQSDSSAGPHEVVVMNADKKAFVKRSYTWAIAASLLLAVSIGTNIFLYQRKQESVNKLNQTAILFDAQQEKLAILQDKWTLVQNPTIKTILLKGVENKMDYRALVFWDQSSKTVYLSIEHLPPAPKGKQYQLWAMVDGKPVSAGVFPLDVKADIASKMLDIPHAQAFAITLEDEGGKDVPTLSALCVMGTI